MERQENAGSTLIMQTLVFLFQVMTARTTLNSRDGQKRIGRSILLASCWSLIQSQPLTFVQVLERGMSWLADSQWSALLLPPAHLFFSLLCPNQLQENRIHTDELHCSHTPDSILCIYNITSTQQFISCFELLDSAVVTCLHLFARQPRQEAKKLIAMSITSNVTWIPHFCTWIAVSLTYRNPSSTLTFCQHSKSSTYSSWRRTNKNSNKLWMSLHVAKTFSKYKLLNCIVKLYS